MKCILNLILTLCLLTSCSEEEKGHFASDEEFVMLSDTISPNKKNKIIEYQFDHGGMGYSRVFWAIVPTDQEKFNLEEYLLPDGYKARGWTKENNALIEKWKPYYYKSEKVDLKSGDKFNGVTIQIELNPFLRYFY
jgi:hypothetical protein